MRQGLALALGLLLLWAAPAAAATSEAALEHGFGRLAVDWPAPVAIIAGAPGAIVEIQASRPFPDDVLARAAELHPLLAAAVLNRTATILELRAAAGVVIETAILDDRSLRVALVPAAAPALGLRLGRHPDFERLVLEPVGEHAVGARRDGARLTLTLPGTLKPADRARLAGVAGIEGLAAAGHQLFLDLAEGARVRPLFVGPDRQVFDIYAAATADRPAAMPAERRAPGASTAGQPATPPPHPRPAALPVIGPTASLPPESSAAEAGPTARSRAVRPTEVPAPWTVPDFAALEIDATRLTDDRIELRFAWPEPVPAAVFVRGAQLWVAFAANTSAIVLDPESFTGAARRFIGAVREESHPAATLIRLSLTDSPVIDVRRDGGIWRIGLAAAGEPTGERPEAVPSATASQPFGPGLLLTEIEATASLIDPIVGDRLGIGMALSATGAWVAPARFIGLRLLEAEQGAVWQQLGEPARGPFWTAAGLYLGPADGVVRTGPTGPALPGPLLDSLPMALDAPSDQPGSPGDTGRPATAELAAAAAEPAVPPASLPPADIGETGSLSPPDEPPPDEPLPDEPPPDEPLPDEPPPDEPLPDEPPPDEPPELAAPTAVPAPGPLDLARFAGAPGRGFWDQRSELLRAAEAADRPDPLALALELARLHVAHGLGPEAVALLADAPAPSPLAAPSTAQAALTGAAYLLAGRHAPALDYLAHADLRADDETALWRAAALAALERWDEALADWQRGEPWLAGYTAANQAALGEHGVMLLLQTGRIDEAFGLLERLATLRLPAAASERLRELEALALERDGAIDEARTIWRDLAQEGSPEARSRGLLRLTASDLEAGRLSLDQAIERLTADSVHWRGQADEVTKRQRLAALQHSAGRSEGALATLQDALSAEPPAAQAALLTSDMTAIVDSLFDELARGERSATATLLLYRRYAELVPPGAAGDDKITGLAESLAELGLDDAAIDILGARLRQSEARAAGRAALGYALASHLARSGDGRAAMAALVDSTPIETIDEHLAEARRNLFAAIGRAGGTAPERAAADLPWAPLRDRARQAFDQGAWAAVIEAVAPIEAELPPLGRLDEQATEVVLMAATAARQLGEDPTIERLSAQYDERLATAADNAVLRLLSGAARFSGGATEVLREATGYTRAMRSALAEMPSL